MALSVRYSWLPKLCARLEIIIVIIVPCSLKQNYKFIDSDFQASCNAKAKSSWHMRLMVLLTFCRWSTLSCSYSQPWRTDQQLVAMLFQCAHWHFWYSQQFLSHCCSLANRWCIIIFTFPISYKPQNEIITYWWVFNEHWAFNTSQWTLFTNGNNWN